MLTKGGTVVPMAIAREHRKEIDRLRQLIMDLIQEEGGNDRTVQAYIGVDPTGFHDEWPNLPGRPYYPLNDDHNLREDLNYKVLAVPLFRRELYDR